MKGRKGTRGGWLELMDFFSRYKFKPGQAWIQSGCRSTYIIPQQEGKIARAVLRDCGEAMVLTNPTPKKEVFVSYTHELEKLEVLKQHLARLEAKPRRNKVDDIGIDFIHKAMEDITSRLPKDWDQFAKKEVYRRCDNGQNTTR